MNDFKDTFKQHLSIGARVNFRACCQDRIDDFGTFLNSFYDWVMQSRVTIKTSQKEAM